MKQITPVKLVVAGCTVCILLTLSIRSQVYERAESNRQLSSSAPSPQPSEKNKITVHFHNRRPFYMSDGDEVHGLVADPIAMAFRHADIPFEWQETPAKRQLDIIERNADASCAAGWFKTPEREAFARYTLPVYQDKPFVAVSRADTELLAETESIDRVLMERRLQLLVKTGYSYGSSIDDGIKKFQPRQVETTAENQNILDMIENYRADYSFMTEEEAHDLLLLSGKRNHVFKLVHFLNMPPGNTRHIICSRQVEPAIISRLDSAIRSLRLMKEEHR